MISIDETLIKVIQVRPDAWVREFNWMAHCYTPWHKVLSGQCFSAEFITHLREILWMVTAAAEAVYNCGGKKR